jgi:hypothetical protein
MVIFLRETLQVPPKQGVSVYVFTYKFIRCDNKGGSQLLLWGGVWVPWLYIVLPVKASSLGFYIPGRMYFTYSLPCWCIRISFLLLSSRLTGVKPAFHILWLVLKWFLSPQRSAGNSFRVPDEALIGYNGLCLCIMCFYIRVSPLLRPVCRFFKQGLPWLFCC